MASDFRIETVRLVMREFNSEDVDAMFELNSDEEVMRHTGDKGFGDRQEVQSLVLNYDQYSKYKMGRWTLLLKSTGEYVGWCGLKYNSDIDEVNLGYRLLRKHWQKGYATESSVASLDYGFDQLMLKQIVCRAAKQNARSLRVIRKLGMIFEKEFMNHNSVWEQYLITPDRWLKHRETMLPSKDK